MTSKPHIYDFAASYTKYPGGRFRRHGPYSGEAFREDVLLPLLQEHSQLVLNLTGTYGFGSSFLDESFGEVAHRIGLEEVKRRLSFVSDDDPALVELIWTKIAKATKG